MPELTPDFLPPVILEYSVNMLAGASGVGKTAFLAWWVQQIQLGLPIFGLQPPAGAYQAFIGADRSWIRSSSKWFAVQGCAPIPHYSLQDDTSFKKSNLRNKRDRMTIFRDVCLAAVRPPGMKVFPPHSVVYVDPVSLFLGGNLLDYDTCLVACSELREIAQDQQVTIIGTAHASKQKADKSERYLRLQDRILGSAALFGYTDTQLYLASPEEVGEECYQFLWAPHHAKSELFPLVRDEEGRFRPMPQKTTAPPPTIEEIPGADWILTVLASGPQPFHVLSTTAREQAMSIPKLQRRLAVLKALGHVTSPQRGIWARVQVQ